MVTIASTIHFFGSIHARPTAMIIMPTVNKVIRLCSRWFIFFTKVKKRPFNLSRNISQPATQTLLPYSSIQATAFFASTVTIASTIHFVVSMPARPTLSEL